MPDASSPPTEAPALQFGTAPVNWNNFDLANWRPVVPFPAILDEMKAAGYDRTEWDASFGNDPATLLAEAESRGMRFVAAYRWVDFVDSERFEHDAAELRLFLPILQAIGVTDLIVADTLRPVRVANAGAIPDDGSLSLGDQEYAALAANLRELAIVAREFGLTVRYHNHVGSYIETPAEVEALLAAIDLEVVNLCFDTGHYAFGGGDPYQFIADHIDAVGLLHLKDVDPNVLAEARSHGWTFQDALRQIIFCPLGEGNARITQVVDILVANDFAGHIIIEQDTCAGDSTRTAALNLERARDFEQQARAKRSEQ